MAASLKAQWPDARIEWLVQDSFADAVRWHPAVSSIVEFPRSRFKRWYHPATALAIARWLKGLRGRRYDLVIDAQGLARSALFTRATGAAVRIGHANAREGGRWAYTLKVDDRSAVHTVDRMLSLVAAAGAPPMRDTRLYLPPALASSPPPVQERYVLIAPTSRWRGKAWPADRFALLARRLLEQPHLGIGRVVVVGSAGERDQCGPLLAMGAGDQRVVDLVGRTSLAELMHAVSHAALVIANDSAAVHMAVGFDRPIVALYGPTEIARVGPYGRAGDVIQHVQPGDAFDHKNAEAGTQMMGRITVDEVAEAAAKRLSGTVTSR